MDTTKAPELFSQLAGKATETLSLWAEANQRVLRQLIDLSAGAATESVKLYGEFQRSAIDALRETQATALRVQAVWQDAPRDPFAWYQQAVAETVTGSQKAWEFVEGQTQAVTRAAERLQASTEQIGKQIQETVAGTVTKVKELYSQN